MKKTLLLSPVLAGSAVLALSSLSPANAFSFTTTLGTGSPLSSTVPGAVSYGWEDQGTGVNGPGGDDPGKAPTVTAGLSALGVTSISKGFVVIPPPNSQTNIYATPLGVTNNYLTLGPSSANPTANTSPVTVQFNKSLNYFGLYWGSIDEYNKNKIEFFDGVTLKYTLLGSMLGTTNYGSHTAFDSNKYVNIFASSGQSFNKLVLTSTQNAFESDNWAVREVPEPLTILGSAIAMSFGVHVKRKLRKEAK